MQKSLGIMNNSCTGAGRYGRIMSISFVALAPSDTDDLVEFLSSNLFPFHVQASPQADAVRARMNSGHYWSESTRGFWVLNDGERIGMVALEDLDEDDAPLFDLRLGESERGKGLGVAIVRALSDLVFETMPNVLRFEGQTREDNIAMRKTFLRAGFIKEAHYRMAWPTDDGGYVASIAYAILRQDWASGTTTRFEWEDLTA